MADARLSKIIFAGGLGSIVEWYNFQVYAYLTVVISKLFFPEVALETGIMLSFLLFAVGFLARPFGALFFGRLADRIGRQHTLVLSQILMALTSLAIACLPTYQQIGYYAPILLAILRLIQGLSVAGEHTTAICYIAEMSPVRRQGFYVSSIPASTAFGILISSLIMLVLLNALPESGLYQFGWRICFFTGSLLALIAVIIRWRLPETHAFLENKEAKLDRPHLLENAKKCLLVAGLMLSWAFFYQLLFIWAPTYLIYPVAFTYEQALIINLVAMSVFIIAIVLGGFLSDYLSRQKMVLGILVAIFLLLSLLLFPLLAFTFTRALMFLSSLGFLFGLYVGVVTAVFSVIFPVAVRALSLALVFNVSLGIVGGLTPALLTHVATLFVLKGIGILSMAVCLISMAFACFI